MEKFEVSHNRQEEISNSLSEEWVKSFEMSGWNSKPEFIIQKLKGTKVPDSSKEPDIFSGAQNTI